MTAAEWIQSTKPPIFFGVGVFLAAAYYFSMYDGGNNLQGAIADVEQKIHVAQDELKKAQAEASDKEKFRQEVNFVSDQLKKALNYLPTQMKTEEVLKKITTEAQAAGIKITKSTPKPQMRSAVAPAPVSAVGPDGKPLPPVDTKFYEELQVDLEAVGTFSNLTQFLANISAKRIERIITLTNLELSRGSAPVGADGEVTMLHMRGTLVAYKYLEKK